MHLLILTPGFPANEQDDSCIPALQSFVYALKTNHVSSVTIISFHYPFFNEQYLWKGCRVHPMNGANVGSWKRLWLWLKIIKQIGRIHKVNPINVIHSLWYSECALIGHLVSRSKKINHITTAMGQEFYRPTWMQFLLKRLPQPRVVVLSERQKKSMRDFGLVEIQLIPWALNPLLFNVNDGDAIRKIDLIFIGSMIDGKRPEIFLRVVQRLSDKYPNLRAVMIGGGPSLEVLREQVHDLGLTGTIKLLGDLSRREAMDQLRCAKILLHPSDYESFGFVYLEALCCGTLIVSGPTGIAWSSETWKVVDNEEEMLNACDHLLDTWTTAPVRDCKYNIDEICRRYVTLYSA